VRLRRGGRTLEAFNAKRDSPTSGGTKRKVKNGGEFILQYFASGGKSLPRGQDWGGAEKSKKLWRGHGEGAS